MPLSPQQVLAIPPLSEHGLSYDDMAQTWLLDVGLWDMAGHVELSWMLTLRFQKTPTQ